LRLGLLAALLALLGACGGGETSPPAAGQAGDGGGGGPAGQAAAGGEKELVVAVVRDGALDEMDAASYNGPLFLFKMIYEGLVEDGGGGKIIPVLAESWDISGDGRTYTFHLRDGVKFSDGTPFNAEAVIFNLKRWVGDEMFSSLSSYEIEDMQAVDPLTVRVTFKRGDYSLLIEQSYPRPVRFLSPASVEQDPGNPKGRFTGPVGTGPWMVETYVKEEGYTLVPNPHYWGERPKIDRLRFKVVSDAQARVMALRSGEVDIIGGELVGKIPIESIPELMADPEFEVHTKDTLCSHLLAFNNDAGKFGDRRLRLAVSLAIDKKAITESLFDGIGEVADGLFQRGVPYATPQNNHGYPGDPERARALLDELGYVDADGDGVRERGGERLELNFTLSAAEFPEWKPLGEFIQSQLSQVGIKVNLNILDRNGYLETTQRSRKFDIALIRTPNDSWMPHSALPELFQPYPDPGRPARLWTDPAIMEMVRTTLATIDPDERQRNYDKLLGFISDTVIAVPVYFPIASMAVNPRRVRNFVMGVNNFAPVEWSLLEVSADD
jgi:peptide/nickel transport system substrate-binding protein